MNSKGSGRAAALSWDGCPSGTEAHGGTFMSDYAMMRHVLAHNGGHEQAIVDPLATLPRPGGTVYLVDVDLAAVRILDADPELDDLSERYVRFHVARGDDPIVGLRLGNFLRAA